MIIGEIDAYSLPLRISAISIITNFVIYYFEIVKLRNPEL